MCSYVFFFKQKTAYEMRISDWSSDVCSSDLHTYVVYTSDNGWHMGEHRQFVGKTTAYEEDIRVPFAIRGPGVPKGARLTPFVLNNDLAPTIAAMADVAPQIGRAHV